MKRWVTAALLSGVLALTACEAEPAEPTEPSSSAPTSSEPTSAAPTTEPTGPVEPTLPPAAEAQTKAGAEAFVLHWWDLVNFSGATGDTTAFRRITAESCETCNSSMAFIEKVYSRGGELVGGAYEVLRQTLVATSTGWAVSTHVRVGRQRVRGAGDLDEVYPGGVSPHVMTLAWNRGSWEVTSWEVR